MFGVANQIGPAVLLVGLSIWTCASGIGKLTQFVLAGNMQILGISASPSTATTVAIVCVAELICATMLLYQRTCHLGSRFIIGGLVCNGVAGLVFGAPAIALNPGLLPYDYSSGTYIVLSFLSLVALSLALRRNAEAVGLHAEVRRVTEVAVYVMGVICSFVFGYMITTYD